MLLPACHHWLPKLVPRPRQLGQLQVGCPLPIPGPAMCARCISYMMWQRTLQITAPAEEPGTMHRAGGTPAPCQTTWLQQGMRSACRFW